MKDLPITLTFRFWADNPLRAIEERVLDVPGDLCKFWFERRSDAAVWVDFDESTVGDDVSDGAARLYDLIKDQTVGGVSNSDIF